VSDGMGLTSGSCWYLHCVRAPSVKLAEGGCNNEVQLSARHVQSSRFLPQDSPKSEGTVISKIRRPYPLVYVDTSSIHSQTCACRRARCAGAYALPIVPSRST